MSNLKAIVAVAENGVIGNGETIPWHISDEFRHFKNTTMGGIVVFGRKTWESLPKKPLPGRENVVITSRPESLDGVRSFPSIDSLLSYYSNDKRDIWICGGASIYKQALPLCSELLISRVKLSPKGDVFFPNFEEFFGQKEIIYSHDLFDVVKYVPVNTKS